MLKDDMDDSFAFKGRRFHITRKSSSEKGVEFIQLSEALTSESDPTAQLVEWDGILHKNVPIMFASRSSLDPEVQVSMQYEGLPVDVVKRFVEFVERMWG
jgi:hypothetical protein